MNVTERLHDLVSDEPPYRLDVEAVVRGGRRRRHRRTAVLSAATAVTAGALVATALSLQPGGASRRPVTLGAAPSASSAEHLPGPLESIVRAHTPDAWTISEAHETRPDGFQAEVDDGDGASRLYLGISPAPGSLQQHPCSDHEFALNSVCREQDLDADTRLVTRGPAKSGPVTSTVVVIVHRDGSGVDVGNDNATWPWVDLPPGTRVTEHQKWDMSTPTVNRPLPVYSLGQLVEIAKAVDAVR